ncbi:MAG: hypothetical protein RLZZ519_853 [Bacteroidota bacterium]
MKRSFSIEKLDDLSGKKAVFYSVRFFDEEHNEFENFLEEFGNDFGKEVNEILLKIEKMAFKVGADITFFKDWEGKPGDGVCALADQSEKNLRLYCIRFGNVAVILGNGGHKPKTIRALQEDDRLTRENKVVRDISKLIAQRMRAMDIKWNGNELVGDLEFNFEDDD